MTRFTLLNYLTTAIFIATFNITGIILAPLLPKNNDLYLDNIVLAEKISEI